MYLVDIDRIIDGLTGTADGIALLRGLRPSGLAISINSYVEVVEGIIGSRDRVAAERHFRAFLQGTAVLGIDQAVAERAATIRADLRRRGRPGADRAMDILIAATAIEHDLSLVTRNTRDYHDVPDLRRLAVSG